MIRNCDGNDPNLVKEDGKTPCDCGSTFDDVDWMVIYPHQQVHGTRTLKPRYRQWDQSHGPPDGTLTLTVRVADLPIPHVASEKRQCYSCGSDVWLSLTTVPLTDMVGGLVVCGQCMGVAE